MRITGGMARGIPLDSGGSKQIRPATDRMREAVFSSLGSRVEGARFLDLFAGSGAYGLEAWSRGASGGVFVEQDRRTVAALLKNLEKTAKSMGVEVSSCRAESADAVRWRSRLNERFNLIFIDPPYEILPRDCRRILDTALDNLADDGRIILEAPGEFTVCHAGLVEVRRLGKGRNQPTAIILSRT